MFASKILAGSIGVLAAVSLSASASAQSIIEDIVVIPIDSVLRAPEGSVTPVASAPVPAEFQGSDCIAEVVSQNQESVHDNNDLILESGGTRGEVLDVEAEAFGTVLGSVPLTLGPTVDISLRMGPDEVSSGGLLVTVDCTQVPPPTTTPPTTAPPTTAPPTSAAPTSVAPTSVVQTTPETTPTTPTGVGGETASNAPATGALPSTGPSGTFWAALVAAAFLATGGGLIFAVRRPH